MLTETSQRSFEPGTTGWTIEDLDDVGRGRLWDEGRYEIVDGVLTKMAPQGIHGLGPLGQLRRKIERHLEATGKDGCFFHEVDLLIRPSRVARPT